jgi:hypothetical protein
VYYTGYWCRVSPIKSNELGMFSSNIIVTFGLDWRIQNPNSRIENESKNTHKLQHARFFQSDTHLVLRTPSARPQSDDRSLCAVQ